MLKSFNKDIHFSFGSMVKSIQNESKIRLIGLQFIKIMAETNVCDYLQAKKSKSTRGARGANHIRPQNE